MPITTNEDLRYVALEIAWRMWGLPYLWGGNDPIAGIDCSGMQVEILQSVGILPSGDWSASMLWGRFAAQEIKEPKAGALVFFEDKAGKIVHVEMCIGDGLSIGASGGGSRTKTLEDAILQNAYVKIRPIMRGRLIRGYLDPFKEVTP